MNSTIDTAMNPTLPAGHARLIMSGQGLRETGLGQRPGHGAGALPMISRIAPDSAAVSTRIGIRLGASLKQR